MILSILSLIVIAAAIFGTLALIDGTGTPSKVPSKCGTRSGPVVDPIVTPEPLGDTFGGLVGKLLEQYDDRAVIVIDPQTRRVIGTTDATKATALKAAALTGAAATDRTVITPDAGQTGRSLAWTAAYGANHADSFVENYAVGQLVTAVKPKRSVASLVSALLAKIGVEGTGEDAGSFCMPHGALVVVDQVNGQITLVAPTTDGAAEDASAALAAVAPGVTDMAAVELSANSSEPEANPPVFEGGATS